MSITRLVATYRVTTPMFCSGADQEKAELRPASFKGALRFWYRALALAQYETVEKVRNAEDVLFGSTRTGQAKVLLSLQETHAGKPIPKGSEVTLGAGYLAGQGLAKYDSKTKTTVTQRPALSAGLRFDVTCLFRSPTESAITDIRRSLLALGMLGGLGSRTRRGLGSLTLEKIVRKEDNTILETSSAPQSLDDIAKALRSFLPAARTSTADPTYTAFSSGSRFLLIPGESKETAENLLERLGKAFLHYRSYGRNGRAAGAQALQWFRQDHDEMLKVAKREVRNGQEVIAPERAVFGLPHNYFFSSMAKPQALVDVNGDGAERRASPLFFHVHHLVDHPPIAILSFLPATFLPSGRLDIMHLKRSIATPTLPDTPNLWKPIHQFLNELHQGNDSNLAATFPGTVEVNP